MYTINDNQEHYIFENKHLTDINPLFVGRERCHSGKTFGPTTRPYTLIHYVMSGKGRVIKQHGEFDVSAGEAFLIHPTEIVTYTADRDDPWYYYWVAFDGTLSEHFRRLDDVISLPDMIFKDMYHSGAKDMGEYMVAAQLFELYAKLFSRTNTHSDYVNQVKDYVKALYMTDITVEKIASYHNLDRRYLSRLFKQRTDMTIQDYIIKQRISAAQRYLMQGLSVEQSARLSGYTDVFNFSKMFKRRTGVSPTQWKKKNQ